MRPPLHRGSCTKGCLFGVAGAVLLLGAAVMFWRTLRDPQQRAAFQQGIQQMRADAQRTADQFRQDAQASFNEAGAALAEASKQLPPELRDLRERTEALQKDLGELTLTGVDQVKGRFEEVKQKGEKLVVDLRQKGAVGVADQVDAALRDAQGMVTRLVEESAATIATPAPPAGS